MDTLLPASTISISRSWHKDIPLILLTGIVLSIIYFALIAHAAGFNNIYLLFTFPNDQIQYINNARHLYEYGNLNGQFIYTPVISTNHLRLYMPGYYFTLAAFYFMFGFSAVASMLPSFFAYILSALLVYLLGKKFYTAQVGLLAAFVFLIYPGNIIMSFQPLTEMTLTFVCLFAFTIFSYSSLQHKYFIFPLGLALLFLFRQTAILVAIPMLAVLISNYQSEGFSKVKLFLALFAASFLIILAQNWQTSNGLYSLNIRVLLNGGFNSFDYGSAFQSIPTASIWSLLIQNITRNLQIISDYISYMGLLYASQFYFYFGFIFAIINILLIFAINLFYSFTQLKKDWLPLASSLLFLTITSACIGFYTTSFVTFYRLILFSFPFLVLGFAKACVHYFYLYKNSKYKILLYFSSIILLVFFVGSSILTIQNISISVKKIVAAETNNLAFMESLPISKNGLLASPHGFAFSYMYKHYPIKWAFVPTDAITLILLNQKFPIGTLVIPQDNYDELKNTIVQLKLNLVDMVSYQGVQYLVFNK